MLENKIFVRFILIDYKQDMSEILKWMKVKPIKTWKINDLKNDKGIMKYKNNGLEIVIENKNILHIDETLSQLIETISPYKEKLRNLNNIEKSISIVIYAKNGMPSICFDLETISFINDIQATIEHDIYCLDSE